MMAKTPEDEELSLASPLSSTLSSATMTTSSVAITTMAKTVNLPFTNNGNAAAVNIPTTKSTQSATATAKNRRIPPFKKVFSSSQLTTTNSLKQAPQAQKSRCSFCAVPNSFQLLSNQDKRSLLSSSLPGMYEKINNNNQIKNQDNDDQPSKTRLLTSQTSTTTTTTSQNININDDDRNVISKYDQNNQNNDSRNSDGVSGAATGGGGSSGTYSPLLLNKIPITAIEPSLIGSLASYLSNLKNFNAEKLLKEIELMLKYFDDAVKKNKLELLNGSCNILIETIALNCTRLRDTYLHLQQIQLRLQILCAVHMDGNQSNNNCDSSNSNKQRTTTSPIIEATNELYRNLSDLVRWSDELYLRRQIKHLNDENNGLKEGHNVVENGPEIPRQLIDDGGRISRLVYVSFKNLIKAYRNLELELRKCYQDYLYNNSKLAEYIMADAIYQRRPDNDASIAIRESIQQALRRRSITPPPEYDRISFENSGENNSHQHHHPTIRMGNGSTSTIASLLSSNSSNSAATTNSSASSSSTTSSNVFRTHRFIPNIISHQAQKMAQHFELKKFRSNQSGNKKDSLPRHHDKSGGHQQPSLSENHTMLSFLFGLSSNSSSSYLKRSESASNIHRINANILLPKHLLQMSTEPSSPSSNLSPVSDRHLSPQYHSSRKHSINDGVSSSSNANSSLHQHYDRPVSSSKQTIDSKSSEDSYVIKDVGTLKQSRSIARHASKESSSPPPPPPPLPPKTYNRTSNGTTTTTSSTSLNNSGRSSIASNTSSLSSSSASSSFNKDTNLRNGHSRMKDCDSGFGSSASAMPSTTGSSHHRQSNSNDFSGQNSELNTKESPDIIDHTQVTLRSKKNNRDRVKTTHNGSTDGCGDMTVSSSSNTIVESKDRSPSCSPPPLPAPDSFLCSTITEQMADDEKENNNVNDSSRTISDCCLCCSSTNRSMIRTYRKPGTKRRPFSMHQQLTKSRSLAMSSTIANNNQIHFNQRLCSQTTNNRCDCCCCCCCQAKTDEQSPRQQQLQLQQRRPSLSMHDTPSVSPPPLPPKRNLHAYMGMVGNYHYPTAGDHFGHTTLRATKSMYVDKPSTTMLVKNHLPSGQNVISSNSSISTTTTGSSFSSINDVSPRPSSSQTPIVDPTDQYEHLPIAPSPPPPLESAPSPPPDLPPRRVQIGGDLPAPPPIRSRSNSSIVDRPISNTCDRTHPYTNNNNTHDHHHPHPHHHHDHKHHHHHHHYHNDNHHHHHHHHCNDTSSINNNNNMILSNDNDLENIKTNTQQDRATIEELSEPSSDNDIEVDVDVDDEDSVVDEMDKHCLYCSIGTNHTEDECILAKIDIPPEMFTLEPSSTNNDSDNEMPSIVNSDLLTADRIRGGQIDALIIKATQASMASDDDETFVDCFLHTYRSFITANDLLTKLTFRYRYFNNYSTFANGCNNNGGHNNQQHQPTTTSNISSTTDIIRQSIARKVVNFITLFISKIYIYDFDKQLLNTMMEFIYQLVSKGDLVNAKFLREKCYEKLRLKEREYCRQQQQRQYESADDNLLDENGHQQQQHQSTTNTTMHKQLSNITDIVHLKTWTLLDFKAEHLAEQMTLLDSRLFYKIEPPEILIWAKEQKEECIPNLSTFTEHFNNMSYWTRSQILKCQEQKEREKYMMKYLKIMKCLRKLNNFNSYLAILSALDCAPISRLDWSKNITDMIRDYGSLIDSSSSFRTYRNILANSKPPCIPYIGLILQDLTFVHIGNSDILADGKINWCKHYKQYKILCQMAQFKQCQYSINENENILAFFDNFQDFLPENVMWQISDSIKPRSITNNMNNNITTSQQNSVTTTINK